MTQADEFVGNAEAFPVLKRWNYLNHASVSPLPRAVADAMRRFIDQFETDGYLAGAPFAEIEKCRNTCARLIGAPPSGVAILKNTAEAISTVAFGLDWQPGDRVVTAAVEYPANVYPWMELQQRSGVELVMLPERDRADGSRAVDVDELLAAAAHPRCRLVALSHVQYASGQRMPIGRIGRWCRERGKLFCVDAIQSLGAIEVDVERDCIDFIAAGSQKWLLGPVGAAIFYIRPDLVERVRPLVIGAGNVVDFENFGDYDYTFRPDAKRHESGTPPLISMVGLRAAVELLMQAGPAAIERRIKLLTDRLIEGLRRDGHSIVSPCGENEWSGIVAFLPAGGGDLKSIAKRLREERKIEIIIRENRLRASPHFYNTERQIDELVDALGSIS